MFKVLRLLNSSTANCRPGSLLFSLLRLVRDKKGVAAVEFGFIAPLMVAMYLGVVELSLGLTADRRVTNVASSTADLISQNETVTEADLDAIFGIAESLLNPLNQNVFETSTLKIKVTSVFQEEGETKVAWSHTFGGATADTPGDDYTLPSANLTQDLSSIIMTEITYTHDSIFDYFIPAPIEMTDTYYVRPRKSLQVVCSDCPGA